MTTRTIRECDRCGREDVVGTTPGGVDYCDRHRPDKDTPTDIVAWAMQAFWDDFENFKASDEASDEDACLNVAQALEAAGYEWAAADVRRAATISFVFGQFGVDQKTSRLYHAVIAAAILDTEDV